MQFEQTDRGWEDVLQNALANDRSALRIICPFIKRGPIARLLRAERPQAVQVITRFNLAEFCEEVSDLAALRLLLDHGAEIRGVRNLHAKSVDAPP